MNEEERRQHIEMIERQIEHEKAHIPIVNGKQRPTALLRNLKREYRAQLEILSAEVSRRESAREINVSSSREERNDNP
jgi:hypothetical protein